MFGTSTIAVRFFDTGDVDPGARSQLLVPCREKYTNNDPT